ncbi:dihydrodipicolinate synthase family protein [Amycolatopsis sp. NPDC051372]|uniref:dihydrodipicolinate synthase family protein n=1 Tax=Amycolatopsis sp. NPDC051372 TaxID=3155669 RepID=UPI00341B6FE3
MTNRWGGVIPPLCTPLASGHEVDVASLERLVDHHLLSGVHGVFALGSAGEATFLPDRQRRTVLETVAKRVAGQVPVFAGAIDTSTLRVLEHIRVASEVGCAAVVVTAPFYVTPHPAEVERHFRTVARQAELPVLAYELPAAVHTSLQSDLVLTLAADGLIAGLKDSSGDDGRLRALATGFRALHESRPVLFTGSELTADDAVRHGVDGIIAGLSNVDPAGYVRLFRAATAGDHIAAAEEQARLAGLQRIVDVAAARIGVTSARIGAMKAALSVLGVIRSAAAATPQLPLNDHEIARIQVVLAESSVR